MKTSDSRRLALAGWLAFVTFLSWHTVAAGSPLQLVPGVTIKIAGAKGGKNLAVAPQTHTVWTMSTDGTHAYAKSWVLP